MEVLHYLSSWHSANLSRPGRVLAAILDPVGTRSSARTMPFNVAETLWYPADLAATTGRRARRNFLWFLAIRIFGHGLFPMFILRIEFCLSAHTNITSGGLLKNTVIL